MIKYIEVYFFKDWTEKNVSYEDCLIYRPDILTGSSVFQKKVLREYCLRMIGFLDAGRIGIVIRSMYGLVKIISYYLSNNESIVSSNARLDKIYQLSSSYVENYNPNLGENGSIANIGHVDLTRYEFRFNYDIVKDHFGLEDSDTYITYFYKFFIYVERCFTDILEIMEAVYSYVSSEGDYEAEDINYIGSEVEEIKIFLNTITELLAFLKDITEEEPSDLKLQKKKLKETVTDNPVIQSVIDRVLTNRDPE